MVVHFCKVTWIGYWDNLCMGKNHEIIETPRQKLEHKICQFFYV